MPRKLRPCGTIAAENRHRAHGETVDAKCRLARSTYLREWRSLRDQKLKAIAEAERAEDDDRDTRAVREILRVLDRAQKVVGRLGMEKATHALREQFAERIEDLTNREKEAKRK